MSTLKDKFILNSYQGVMHSDGELDASGIHKIYDGLGNETSLSLGQYGNGATVSGNLSSGSLKVGQLTFPTLSSSVNNVLLQAEGGNVEFSDTIPSSLLSDLSPDPANTYTGGIKSITVNSKGLTTDVETFGDSNYTITSTTYKQNAGTPFSVIPVTTEWSKVFLTDAIPSSHLTDVKSVVLYMQPTTTVTGLRQSTIVVSSPNQSDIYPVFHVQGGEGSGSGDSYGAGTQFTTVVGGVGTNSLYIYIKNIGTNTTTFSFDIHLIAYQR